MAICKMYHEGKKISCSSPKLQPPFLPLRPSWEGQRPWLERCSGRWCGRPAGEGRAAVLELLRSPRGGRHPAEPAGALPAGRASGVTSKPTCMAQPDTPLGAGCGRKALKILRPGGKRRTVAVPEAWLPQPQPPSSSPFPRLGTVGDRFCGLGWLSLPAHLSLSP